MFRNGFSERFQCRLVATTFVAACGLSTACGESSTPSDTTSNETGTDSSASTSTSDATESEPVVDTSEHSYAADDALIQYTGRMDTTKPAELTFSVGGAKLAARFLGTGVTLVYEDEFKWGNSRNWLDVYIDGAFVKKIAAEEGQTEYELASDLEVGEHDVVVAKRTEPGIGRVTIQGLKVAGTLIEPPARPERRIEVIGDSITAGAGVEAEDGSEQCSEDAWNQPGGWGQPYHDANESFGAVAAAELGAEAHIIGVSGIGLVRNYTSVYDTRPMPEVYDLMFPEDESSTAMKYDTSSFIPDVVVIALGTNDFSPGDNPPEDPRPSMDIDVFVDAYIAFIDQLRQLYPVAEIVMASSPMLGDGWPNAEDTFRQDQLDAIAKTEMHFQQAGDAAVHSFETAKQPGHGCGTHPDVEQQHTVGVELAGRIREITGWQ